MNTLIVLLQFLGAAIGLALLGLVLCALCLFALSAWIARGESDSSDAALRDAGFDADEIEAANRHWDRGSSQTETRPNLPYARRLNRERLRGVSGV